MTQQRYKEIRDKDLLVIQHLGEGKDDVQKITSATILEEHHVTYAFGKIEELATNEEFYRRLSRPRRQPSHPTCAPAVVI